MWLIKEAIGHERRKQVGPERKKFKKLLAIQNPL
jgi:hypothetical protein